MPSLVRVASLVGALAGLAAPALADGTSTDQNPTVTFGTPGQKTVTLTVCNPVYQYKPDPTQCVVKTVTITVLDPAPSLQAEPPTPAELDIPNSVHLSATVAGQPPLTVTWTVRDATLDVVATFDQPTADWSTAAVAPGLYTAVLEVTNAVGPPAISLPFPIVVDPDPRIFWSSFEGAPPDASCWVDMNDGCSPP